jgi:hypothetical protein
MKNEFVDYLNAINMSETLQARVEAIYEIYEEIVPDEITGIFVTDYVTDEGLREFESLWFFSDRSALEAKSFVNKYDLDYTPLSAINYWKLEAKQYDFGEATVESRLRLHFTIQPVVCNLRASRENCDYLMQILKEFVVPNVAE